jgi:tetratricopeptide (TPR) repeat protein
MDGARSPKLQDRLQAAPGEFQITLAERPTPIADYGSMEIPVGNTGRRLALLLVSLATAAILIFQAGRLWLANSRLESDKVGSIERGAALVPGDGAAWDRLGRARQWDFLNSDVPAAITDYKKAVEQDPGSAFYWMDLAGAYEAAGDQARAQDSYAQAKAVYPASAEVAFHYGNFLLRVGKYPEGYRELQRAVRADPKLLSLAISRTWRSSGDVDQLLDQMLPADKEAYLQAVDFFASIRQPDPALAVWHRLVILGQPFPLQRAFPILDELIHEDRADDARRLWREALVAAGLPHAEPSNHSLVWNGDFARDFANGGLDWRWSDLPGVAIGFDSAPAPNGSRALRLDFGGGSNLAVNVPFEYVPVEPSRSYHFSGFMRTQEITTESGMRLAIGDPNHVGAPGLITDNFTGSRPWTSVEGDLTTGPQTHFLFVRLFRTPSRLFDNKLGGTVWIADISLVLSSADSGPRPQ